MPGVTASASLLEREAELSQLEQVTDRLTSRESSVVVVEGPAGVGKSSLLHAFDQIAAQRGVRRLRASGAPREQGLAWSIVHQLFGPALMECRPSARRNLLADAASLAKPVLGLAEQGPGEIDRSATLYGLYWLTLNLAEPTPLLLLVDDAQWADHPSLEFLAYLASRLDGSSVGLGAAIREGETHASDVLLDGLRSAAANVTLRPAPLSLEGSTRLIRQLTGGGFSQRLCTAVHTAAGGNPFLIHELCDELSQLGGLDEQQALRRVRARASQRLSRSVCARLGRLHPAALGVALAVAVLGSNATTHSVGRLVEIGERDLVAAITALLEARIVSDRAGILVYEHPLICQAVYESATEAQRGPLHGRAARLLSEDGRPATEVASQLLHAPPRAGERWRIDALRQAATAALASGAPEMASAYLRRALPELPNGERYPLLVELAEADLQHDPAAAMAHLELGPALADAPARQTQVAQLQAQGHALLSEFGSAVRALGEALATAGDDDDLRRAIDSDRLAYARWDLGSQPLRQQLAQQLRRRATQPGSLTPRESANLAHELATWGEERDTAIAHARAALQATPSPRGTQAARVLHLTGVLIAGDLVDEAESWVTEALTDAQARGSPVDAAVALALATHTALRRGAISNAIECGRAALALRPGELNLGAIAWLIEGLAEHGEAAAAEALLAVHGLDRRRTLGSESLPPRFGSAVLLQHRARMRAVAGHHEAALEDLHVVGELADAWSVRNPRVLEWRSSAARSLIALGDRERAAELAAQELTLADRWGTPTAIGVALCVAGECEPGPKGLTLLEEANKTLVASPARLEHARAMLALGSRLRRERRAVEAREVLREALDLAGRCGGTVLAARAWDELVAAGGRPRRHALRGHAALTGRELRVAELAVEGQTNRQIAQMLFLSPRTVEHHLRTIYRKLGIASRDELAGALAGHTAS